jgi:hypothetical protein
MSIVVHYFLAIKIKFSKNLDSFLELSQVAHPVTECLELVLLACAHVVHAADLLNQLVDVVPGRNQKF